jgi:aminopeptidase N
MAGRIRAAYASPAEAWKSFYLTYKPSAYAVDQTAGTISVWQPLDNLDQAKSNYGPIVYNKAPSIIKQLNYLVGDSLFRLGLHHFLGAHAYGNATWRDLLDAIGDAAHRPLRSWGAQYILRPGMPVIDQTVRTDKNGTFVRLRQRPADSLSGQGAWPIRMTLLARYADSSEQRLPLELRGTDTTIRVAGAHVTPPVFVFANADDYAYTSVVLDSASVFWLVDHIGTLRDPLLRAMAWEALWDQVRSARVSPMHYLSLIQRELPLERDEQISTVLFQRTTRAATAYLSSYQRDTIAPEIEAMFRGIASDTTQSAGTRKLALNALTRITYTAAGTTLLDSLLTGPVAGITPPSQPARWLIVTKLIELAAPTALQRVADETRRDSTTDGQKRAFIAGAAYPDSITKQRYFQRYFNDRSLNEEWVTASLGAFNALDAQALTRRYLRPALDSLPWIQQNRRIFFIGSWLEAFINGHSEPEDAAVVNAFLRDRASLTPDLRRKVLQAADELNRTAAIRRTFANGLRLSQI